MARFKYSVLDINLKNISGIIIADSMTRAAASLKEKGFTITSLKKEEDNSLILKDENKKDPPPAGRTFGFIKAADKILILRQLATLILSGISVVPALKILEKQTQKKKLKQVLNKMINNIESGVALSQAMAEFPKIFNKMVTSIIKTGEETGLIDESLKQVALYLEKKSELKKQIVSSVIYPIIVLVMTVGVVLFLAFYVIPQLIPFIEMAGGNIPWNTQLILDFADFLQSHYQKMLIFIVTLSLGILISLKSKEGKYYIDKYKMKIPVIGLIFQYAAIINFTRTLSILLESGVSIVQALRSTSEVVGNELVRRAINNLAEGVLGGENLSELIKKEEDLFLPMVNSMIKVGEETGAVDNALQTLTDMFNDLLNARIKMMTALMEPFLILFMALIVGFVAWGLIAGVLSSYGA